TGGQGRDGHYDQAGHEDPSFPQPVDEEPTGRGEHQSEEGEGAHDHRRGGDRHVEALRELWQDRGDESVSERDGERRRHEDPDVGGQPGARPVVGPAAEQPPHADRSTRSSTSAPKCSASTGTRSSTAWKCPKTSNSSGTRSGTNP